MLASLEFSSVPEEDEAIRPVLRAFLDESLVHMPHDIREKIRLIDHNQREVWER